MNPAAFQRALYRLLLLALLSCVFTSGAVLNLLYPYVSPGGSLFVKIHPGTYLIFFGFCWLTVRQGVTGILARNAAQGWAGQFAVIVLSIGLINFLKFGPSGAAYILDTLLAPPLAIIIMGHLTQEQRTRLAEIVLTALFLNSLAAIGEFVMQTNMLPRGKEGGIYFRASGFLGHPLNNGLITAPMLPLLLLTDWRPSRKLLFASVYVVSILAFGARSALGVGLIALVAAMLLAGCALISRKRMPLQWLMAVPWGLAIAIASLAILLLGTNFGTRFIERGVMDDNAAVRVNSFNLLSYLSDAQLWNGIDTTYYQLLLEKYPDLTIIENFWINLLVSFGIPIFCAFVASLMWFFYGLQRKQPVSAGVAVLSFVLIASTNNSLSTKSAALMIFSVVAAGLRREHAARWQHRDHRIVSRNERFSLHA
jgi:polysaccharide biosynthesis protein VpsF